MIEVDECVICHDRGGYLQANTHRPTRVSLVKYGVDGRACYGCYATVRYRASHGLDPVSGERIRR